MSLTLQYVVILVIVEITLVCGGSVWYVDTAGADTPSCGSARGGNACASLRGVLQKGNAIENGTVYVVASNTPYPCTPWQINVSLAIQGLPSTQDRPLFDCNGQSQALVVRGAARTVFSVTSLSFRNCSSAAAGGCIDVTNTPHVSITDCVVYDAAAVGNGGAIHLLYENEVSAARVVVTDNSFYRVTAGAPAGAGGAVAVEFQSPTRHSHIAIGGNGTVRDVTAGAEGGALAVAFFAPVVNTTCDVGGSLSFTSVGAQGTGGAIYLAFGDTVTDSFVYVSGNHSFNGVSSYLSGGAIAIGMHGALIRSHVAVTGSHSFRDATALTFGGAIVVVLEGNGTNSSMSLQGAHSFEYTQSGNHGGAVAIFSLASSLGMEVSIAGAISFSHVQSVFGAGGAVYVNLGGTVTATSLSLSGEHSFFNVYANESGGAVALFMAGKTQNAHVEVSGSSRFMFTQSTATGGAIAIFFNEFSRNTSVTVCGSHRFESTETAFSGGSISVFYQDQAVDSSIRITGDLGFFDTYAAQVGGAISISYGNDVYNTDVAIEGNIVFARTRAAFEGGAVYVRSDTRQLTNVTVGIRRGARFLSTHAGTSGGAITVSLLDATALSHSMAITIENITVENSYLTDPSSYGGAIRVLCAADIPVVLPLLESQLQRLWTHPCHVTVANVLVQNATAVFGAGLAVYNGMVYVSNVTAVGSVASGSGGALFAGGTATVTLSHSFIDQRSASQPTVEPQQQPLMRSNGHQLHSSENALPSIQKDKALDRYREASSQELRKGSLRSATSRHPLPRTHESVRYADAAVSTAMHRPPRPMRHVGQQRTDTPLLRKNRLHGHSTAFSRSQHAVFRLLRVPRGLRVGSPVGVHAGQWSGLQRDSGSSTTEFVAGGTAIAFQSNAELVVESSQIIGSHAASGPLLSASSSTNVSVSSSSFTCAPGFAYSVSKSSYTELSSPWTQVHRTCCVSIAVDISCTACPVGTYALARGSSSNPDVSCVPAPYGSVSTGADNLRALPGFWGVTVTTPVSAQVVGARNNGGVECVDRACAQCDDHRCPGSRRDEASAIPAAHTSDQDRDTCYSRASNDNGGALCTGCVRRNGAVGVQCRSSALHDRCADEQGTSMPRCGRKEQCPLHARTPPSDRQCRTEKLAVEHVCNCCSNADRRKSEERVPRGFIDDTAGTDGSAATDPLHTLPVNRVQRHTVPSTPENAHKTSVEPTHCRKYRREGECGSNGVCGPLSRSGSLFRGESAVTVGVEQSRVEMYPCPSGYCCPGPSACSTYDDCANDRAGVLCGSCASGYSQMYSSPACAPNHTCGGTYFFPVAILFAIIVALAYLVLPSSSSTGKLSVVTYFYQILALLLVETTETDLWEKSLAAVFNLRVPVQPHRSTVSTSSSETVGICPVQGLTAVGNRLLHLTVPLVIFGALAGLLAVDRAIYARNGHHYTVSRRRRFLIAALSIAVLAYTTTLENTFSLLHCVHVQGEKRLFLDANIRCFQPWQGFLFVIVTLLYVAPLVMVWWQWRRRTLRLASDALYVALEVPYRTNMWYWEAVSLVRRLLIVSVYVFVSDVMVRQIVLVILCVAALLAHVAVQPFRTRFVNLFESCSLGILSVIALMNVRGASYMVAGFVPEGPLHEVAEQFFTGQAVLAVVPLGIFLADRFPWILRYLRRRSAALGRDGVKHTELRRAHVLGEPFMGTVDSSCTDQGSVEERL